MAGIYIHVPFCRKACTYCNFHFSTNLDRKNEYLHSLLKEIELRKDFLNDNKIRSIYFGGGTPSVLSKGELLSIFERLSKYYDFNDLLEVSFEANPDDLTEDYIKDLGETPIDRLSIGIQSFNEKILQWMNRSHNSHQAVLAIENAQKYGFKKLTVDLIYGVPGRSLDQFREDLDRINKFGIHHFSAYALTVEPKTLLAHRIKKGIEKPPDETDTTEQFDFLMDYAQNHGYEHYEISNFAKPECRAVHNSSYWKGIPYLGLGPSAHSYDGQNRFWNISNNAIYHKKISNNELPHEMEELTLIDQFNEYIMTGLRLTEGISIEKALSIFPEAKKELLTTIEKMEKDGLLICLTTDNYQLTRSGKHLADYISAELMMIN
ncbi:MAG: radical SAM family heme chaperone HemW [Saprospirales bacterium]|nr:MAG: radical SAM family heme chaperone HemW [Saprospirales bacterium]